MGLKERTLPGSGLTPCSAPLNTTSIQTAIDACHDAGGGMVTVPKGVFLTGSLRLKSRVVLRLEKDAVLRSSPNIADYTVETTEQPYGAHNPPAWRRCLIYAGDAQEVGIEGLGTIDGQGGVVRKVFPNKQDPQRQTPMLIRFERCKNIKISGLTLLDPSTFTTFNAPRKCSLPPIRT
ncbi:probable polygalacturonase [Verrucomicrobiota bacterium]|nr:probable polygalacturonase [Verrucomicrobiota bacterium]